jgi:hypothetical protein
VIAKTVAAPATKEIGKSLTTQALQLAKILSDLHRAWKPHPGQKLIIKKLFGDGAPAVMSEWGRKGGKTETIEYFLTRGGLTRGGGWYYFAPEQKQAKEIVWASGRLQKFVPRHYIAAINNTEMRITLTNGSFIKVDGSTLTVTGGLSRMVQLMTSLKTSARSSTAPTARTSRSTKRHF